MNLALNEIEAIAKKATRGAGYSWGMSEEAAKATRWLCANGIDGVQALATVLNVADSTEPDKMSPQKISDEWQASSGVMCPLMAGATLSDFAGVGTATKVTISKLVAPALLLPFAGMAARQLGTPVTVEWDGVMVTTDGVALSLNGAMERLTTDRSKQVTIRRTDRIGQTFAQHSRATPTDANWATLNRFAHRTYAPATEESRLKGAGAGLSDND